MEERDITRTSKGVAVAVSVTVCKQEARLIVVGYQSCLLKFYTVISCTRESHSDYRTTSRRITGGKPRETM